jgi:ABC-type Zn uptake system ZnuABC Zn-binding protein ZnuA
MATALRRVAAFILPLLLAGALVACSDDDDGGPESGISVVTSVSPITSLTENIGGTKIRLQGLVPEGTNSHTYEPPVSDVRRISGADLIIVNGLRLEEPILELANANKKPSARIVQLGDLTITPEQYKYDFSFPRQEGKPNPHLWPDPVLAQRYAEHIHAALVELDPANRDYYDANLAELAKRLEALDAATRTAVNSIPQTNRKLLTYHDSWAYFADRYGMTVIGAVQPSDFAEPSAREVAQLIDQVKAERVPAVFGSEVFPSPVLEQIARESGAKFVDELRDDDLPGKPGDKLHSYIGLMVQNLRIMVPALGGNSSSVDNIETGPVFTDGAGSARYAQ